MTLACRVEQEADQRGSAPAVYALGGLLYHVLAGRPPYLAPTSDAVLALVAAGPPEPLRGLAPDAPSDLIAIAERAMARDPAARFRTAAEMADELKRFQTGQLVTSHHYTLGELVRRWVRRHRAPLTVAALALAVLVVLGALGIDRIVATRRVAERERARAQRELAAAFAQKGEAAEHDRAWAAAATYYQASLREADSSSVRLAAGRAESRMIAPIARHLGHAGWVHAVAVVGGDAITVDELGGVQRWATVDGKSLASRKLGTTLYAVAASPDGSRVAVAGDDGRVYELGPDLAPRRTFDDHDGRIWAIAFSPDGKTLATAGEDKTIHIWNDRGERTFSGHEQRVYAAAFSPDGSQLVSASDDRTVRLWSVATGESTIIGRARYGVRDVAFSHDGHSIAYASWDANIYVVDVRDSRSASWPEIASLHAIAFSPDGQLIATGGDSTTIRLCSRARWVRSVVWRSPATALGSLRPDAMASRVSGTSRRSRGSWAGPVIASRSRGSRSPTTASVSSRAPTTARSGCGTSRAAASSRAGRPRSTARTVRS